MTGGEPQHAVQETGENAAQVVLFEPDGRTRSVVSEELRGVGCAVAPFADARMALLFLLGRLEEVDGAIVNVDKPGQGDWLLRRLRLVPAPLAIVTYSARRPKTGTRIQQLLEMRGMRRTRGRPIKRALADSSASA